MSVNFDLSGVAPCEMRVETTQAPTLESLRSSLAESCGDGWLCFTDRVVRWRSGAQLSEGIPLSGELVLAEDAGQSIHLRQGGAGWVVTRLHESPADGVVGSTAHVVFEERFENSAPTESFPEHGGGAPAFVYRIVHKTDQDGVYQPWLARFAGWEAKR